MREEKIKSFQDNAWMISRLAQKSTSPSDRLHRVLSRAPCRSRQPLVVLAKKKRPARPKLIPLEPLNRSESVSLTIRASHCRTWQQVAILVRLYAETPDIPPLPPINIAALFTSLWRVLQKLPPHASGSRGTSRQFRGRRPRQTLIHRLEEGSTERRGLEDLLGKMAVAAGRSLPSATITEVVAVARAASMIGCLSGWLWDSIEERSLELLVTGEWRRVPLKERDPDEDWTIKTDRSLAVIALLVQAMSVRVGLTAQAADAHVPALGNNSNSIKRRTAFERQLPSPPLLPSPLSSLESAAAAASPGSWDGPSLQWISVALSASKGCMMLVKQEQRQSNHSQRSWGRREPPSALIASDSSSPSITYCRALSSLPHSFYIIHSCSLSCKPSYGESIEGDLRAWAELWLLTSRPLIPFMSLVDLHRCSVAMRTFLLPLLSGSDALKAWLEAFKIASLALSPQMGASQIRAMSLLAASVSDRKLSDEWRAALEERRRDLLLHVSTG